MKTALVLRHVHFENLGLLGEVLEMSGYRFEYREAGAHYLDPRELASTDLLVVLGGPIGVYEDDIYPFLGDEISGIQMRLSMAKPVLGICLGAQLIARALESRVYPSGCKEIGWAPVILSEAGQRSVLAPLAGLSVLHWHGDTFDLPAGAELLASTPKVAHQAFSIGHHVLALQFHLEAQPALLERWYIGHACEIAATPDIDVPTLRRQAAAAAPALAGVARKIFATWLNGLTVSSIS